MRTLIALFALASAAMPQGNTVPPTAATTDARSAMLMPGFELPARMQVLVDEAAMPAGTAGRSITALSVRRDFGFAKAVSGGAADLRITMSIAPLAASAAREAMSANVAADPLARVVVFQGTVTVPSSADPTGRSVGWSDAQDVVHFVFQTPFSYPGGTLCIDVWGAPAPTGGASYWPVDAAMDPVTGQVVEVGEACGQFGGRRDATAPFLSAFVAPRTLQLGASTTFLASGELNLVGAAIFGTVPAAFDLQSFGIGGAGCTLYIGDPIVFPVLFGDRAVSAVAGGQAKLPVQLPTLSALAGSSFRVQFLELSTPLRTSNALDCTIAPHPSTLGMSTVFAWSLDGSEPQHGKVDPARAPVMRLMLQ